MTEKEKETSRENPHALESALESISEIAKDLGLDPYNTHFELVPPDIMHEMNAYLLPGNYSHWTHGRTYSYMKTLHDYGLQVVYEMVINTDPSIAFLLETNTDIENKFVIAHVLGHTDMDKNNCHLNSVRRDMHHRVAANADRIRTYEQLEGKLEVEKFIDAVLTITEHVDTLNPTRPGKDKMLEIWKRDAEKVIKPPESPFDDLFGKKEKGEQSKKIKIPLEPDRDLLGFIGDFAPYLSDWQRDIIDILREESIYFRPQMRIRIMSEGWASFSHKRIMREMAQRNLLTPSENEAWWKLHAGVVAPNPKSLNPYFFGMKMFEWIEDWYNGNITEYERKWLEAHDFPIFPKYNGPEPQSPGYKKARQVMEENDDQSFIRNYFNKIPGDRMNVYLYTKRETSSSVIYEVTTKDWEEIRDKIVDSLTNCGYPYITVEDGDYLESGQLYLKHSYSGEDLDEGYVKKTLPYVFRLWGRTVWLESVKNNKKILYMYNPEKGFVTN